MRPQSMKAQRLLDSAAKHLATGDYRACHADCIAAIKCDPHLAEPYYLLGILTADHSNFSKALELFDRAIAAAPTDARFLAQRAKCLTAMNRQQEASETADKACGAKPEDALTLDTIGVVLSRVGRHAEALEYFERAVTLAPNNASYQYNFGSALQFSGDFERAQRTLEISLRLDPTNYKVYTSLTGLKKQTPDDNHIEVMKRLFDESADGDERLQLGHALAKSFEDLAQYGNALAWLTKGKQQKRKALNYSFSEHEKVFHAAAKLAPPPLADEAQTGEANPIFVVGMPRTGTTLVDRILSSHASVVSIGELTNFGLLLKQAAKTASPYVLDPETLEKSAQTDLRKIGTAYIESTRRLRGDSPYFVDKMPLNFFYAPLILAALPSARIIVLRRNPMDACLSNYRQLFRTSFSYYNYTHDLSDTAKFYAGFEALMTKWRDELPASRFMEIYYEDIVAEQEKQTRTLISFCGLPWMDQCLHFHENAAPVATASSVQVRQPLYSSSIGRWKRYGDALAPLRNALTELGVVIED